MTLTIGIIAQGAMGAGIAARLTRHGINVLTSLEGRSAASAQRAKDARMQPATDEEIAGQAKLILSILPPEDAVALAERFAPALRRAAHPATYLDCNAVSVGTVKRIGDIITAAGARFVDAGIIGMPPLADDAGPRLYVSGDLSGDVSDALTVLKDAGLDVRRLNAAAGAASALKLSYAGINKGLIAIAITMILAAERAGAGAALKEELAESQADLLKRFSRSIKTTLPKAYRWGEEMRFIAEFIGKDFPESGFFTAAAELYDRVAVDFAENNKELAKLERFLGR